MVLILTNYIDIIEINDMINPYAIIDKYYGNQLELKKLLVKHSEAVANKALQLVERHAELRIDKLFLVEAALLHDIGIFKTDAPGILCCGSAPYIAHGYLGADLLREEGLPKHALVCERHTGTGLSLETIIKQNLPIPHRDMTPISLEEQLICFADKFFSKSHIDAEKSVDEARKSVGKFGDECVGQFDIWCDTFL